MARFPEEPEGPPRYTGWDWASGPRKPRSTESRGEPPDPEALHAQLCELEEPPVAIVMGAWQWRKLRAWRFAKPNHFVGYAGDPDCFDRVPVVIKGKRYEARICRTHDELEDAVLGRD